MECPYSVLGLVKDATEDEIKKQYKKLAKEYHPDVNKSPDAEQKFKELQAAYSILSDPDKKEQYDQYGNSDFSSIGYDHSRKSMHDMMKDFAKGFGFGYGFGQQENRRKNERRIYGTKIDLTLKEMYFGAKKTIVFSVGKKCLKCNGNGAKDGKIDTCQKCNGSGRITIKQTSRATTMIQMHECNSCRGSGHTFKQVCEFCHGVGENFENENVEIDVMRGICPTNKIRIEMENYSVVVSINQINHETFIRNGDDLSTIMKISLVDAIFGVEKEIELIDESKIKIKISPGTNCGTIQRISGKGMVTVDSRYGDLYIKILFDTPKLPDDQKDKLVEILNGMY